MGCDGWGTAGWVRLNTSTGEISGTPSVDAVFNFTVEVTDSSALPQTATDDLSITVAVETLVVTTASLPNGLEGAAYSETLAASGGTTPYTWAITAGALPDGLSLNNGTGEISGTCTVVGTFDFTVEATDSAGTPQTAYAGIVDSGGRDAACDNDRNVIRRPGRRGLRGRSGGDGRRAAIYVGGNGRGTAGRARSGPGDRRYYRYADCVRDV